MNLAECFAERASCNSPASLLATVQKAAVAIQHAVPSTSDPVTVPPVHMDRRVYAAKPRHIKTVFLLFRTDGASDELGQTAGEWLKVLLICIFGHIARQNSADGDQRGGVRAEKHRLRFGFFCVEVGDDP